MRFRESSKIITNVSHPGNMFILKILVRYYWYIVELSLIHI